MSVVNENSGGYKRKFIRFRPDPLAVAYLAYSVETEKSFSPEIVALIVDEAPLGGCSLITFEDERLKTGLKCTIKVGNLAPLISQLVWKKKLEDNIVRVGFKFLE